MKPFRIFLILFGAVLVLDTILIYPISNFNLGVILPAILGLPLLVSGILLPQFHAWAKKNAFGRFLKWLLISGYGIFTALFLATLTLMLSAVGSEEDVEADAVIVLGAGVRGSRISLTLSRRLEVAVRYYNEHPNVLLVLSGGQGQGEDLAEADAMEQYLLNRGIPKENILKEEQSTSTYENFEFSLPLIRERLGENARIAFITSRFHVYRAREVASAAGVTASGMGSETTWFLIPNCYLREAVAIWVYKITGKIA